MNNRNVTEILGVQSSSQPFINNNIITIRITKIINYLYYFLRT